MNPIINQCLIALWDSLFKAEGSSVFEVVKDKTDEKNRIKIVSESSAKKGFGYFDQRRN
jgi:hypothetical protein